MSKLKELREKAKYTQNQVGLILNVTQGAVSQWETGECFPKTELLPKLAQLYNCAIDDLLANQPQPAKAV